MTPDKEKQEACEVIVDGPGLFEVLINSSVLFLEKRSPNKVHFNLKGVGWKTAVVDGIIWNAPGMTPPADSINAQTLLICAHITGHGMTSPRDNGRSFIALYNLQTRKGQLWYKECSTSDMLCGIDPAADTKEKVTEACAQRLALCQSSLRSLAHATKIQLLKNFIRQAPFSDLTKKFLFWFIAENRDLTEQISAKFRHPKTTAIGYTIQAELTRFESVNQLLVPLSTFVNDMFGIEVPTESNNSFYPKVLFWTTAANKYFEIDLAFSPRDLRGPFRMVEMTPELLAEIEKIPLS